MNRFFHLRAIAGGIAILAIPSVQAVGVDRPAAVQALASKGVTNIQELKPSGDVRIFSGVANQNPVAIYATKDGTVIVGTRIDKNADPMDMDTIADSVAKPLDESTWHQLESAKWIRDGKADAPRVVYAISDPNCPWCHKFWEAARPYVDSGKVQLRHILVGIIRADSAAKAAAVLEASNPAAMLEKNERSFSTGGVVAAKAVSVNSKRTLTANLQLMEQLGFTGTPAIIFKRPDGSLGKVNGFPQGRLAEVMGTN